MVTTRTTLNEAVSFNPMSEHILSRFGINGRERNPIFQVALKENVNPDFLVDVLNYFDNYQDQSLDRFSQYSIPVLVDYLEKSHRHYQEKKLPEIEQTINNLISDYGKENPLLNVLKISFYVYQQELAKHFLMEEELLFPYSKLLEQTVNEDFNSELSLFSLEYYLVRDFIEQHEHSHQELKRVQESILSYTLPSINRSPYRILIDQLKNFEDDLHFHSLIEDEILVPKLQQLEAALKSTSNSSN